MIQWPRSLYPRQISSCLVWFLFGPGPILCCFAVLLGGETQIWLGDLRVVFGRVFFGLFVLVLVMICQSFWTTRVLFIQAFHRLRYCKDRA